MKLTNVQEDKLLSFLTETFCFTEKQSAAMYYQVEMTQEIYDSIIDRCFQLGKNADKIFFRMMNEFPTLFEAGAQKILEECEIEE